jgi:hypothetical protein
MSTGEPTKESPKKIYIKSDWIPGPTEDHIEKRLKCFDYKIQRSRQILLSKQQQQQQQTNKQTNITKLQETRIQFLNNSNEFIILMADKNLGPCIMEQAQYIKQILNEYLENGTTYTNLSHEESKLQLQQTQVQLHAILQKYIKNMETYERDYFNKSALKSM